eukprot:c3258_g1_i1.p1 GENE.c3258_g1_i1~~c3258_g1_i1.p1  ORF type:complete len:186 (-),score=41.75 c3258_g1_i1:63-593(-)
MSVLFGFFLFSLLFSVYGFNFQTLPNCTELQPSQFLCAQPEIDPRTQGHIGCPPTKAIEVPCQVKVGVACVGSQQFNQTLPCRHCDGKDWRTALCLSVFLGLLGIDRFYLGYPVIGILKFLTFGGFVFGNIADILLISTQIVGPADGSDYAIPAPMPIFQRTTQNSNTFQSYKIRS